MMNLKSLEISSFYTCVPKTRIIWGTVPDIRSEMIFFLSFWAIFYPFTTLTTWKIKILKKWKKFQKRHHHFAQVYHKGQSYDIYFLRYQLQQTDFFVILGHFLPFYLPLTARKMKISRKREKLEKKNEENIWKYHHFMHMYRKSWSYALLFLRYMCVTNVIVIFSFGLFFALLPP